MPDKHQLAQELREDVPSTIARSEDKAVRTYKKTLESAEESYGRGERAHRAAFGALKHTYEKVGDHWEPKDEAGPSDPQAAQNAPDSLQRPKNTAEGVDANASKAHLVEVANKLDITGATRMRKDGLVDEIRKANARATRGARS
jgi:cation transport regulator ChaB